MSKKRSRRMNSRVHITKIMDKKTKEQLDWAQSTW